MEERAVAVEAITCAIAGNTVRIAPNRRRTAREIGQILEAVASELDAEVTVVARDEAVEVAPTQRA